MIIWLYWAQYLLTLLISSFLRLPQHSASPPSLLSFLLSIFLSWTFCYLICFPRTIEFANTQLVKLTIIWLMISWSHLLHSDGKWAPFSSLQAQLCSSHATATCLKSGLSLIRGLTQPSKMCISHLGQANEVFFKVHLPYPKKLIACAISEKSWS